ncbi:SHOCT domain-containing protein [Paraclostridium tenue]
MFIIGFVFFMIFIGIIGFKINPVGGGFLILFGSAFILACIKEAYSDKLGMKEINNDIDRSENILDKIGGVDNIDINLSKYGDESQLIVLKNKTVHIGHNNYETEKFIDFDSIIKLEIRINDAKVGTAHQYSENKIEEVIESIVVYIHTAEYTEELVFRYSSYELEDVQIKYNEILKGLKRLKILLGDTHDMDDLDKTTSINVSEKSIPAQIKEYKELLDIDAITKEEFEMKKKELLNR